MKKIGLFCLVIAATLAGCDKNKTSDEPGSNSFPTDNLVVDDQQNVLVIETTGAWCQYCPNGAEQMKAEVEYRGDRLVALAAHTGDQLEGPPATLMNSNFPTSGVPNFYVMNEDAGQSISGPISAAMYPEFTSDDYPYFGVKHAVTTTDSSFNVYVKVEVLKDINEEDFFVESYLVLDAVLAKDYGNGLDLNQVSSVPLVKTGSGTTPSTWDQDAAYVNGVPTVKKGDLFYHEHSLFAQAFNTGDWGRPLAAVNPFGKEFIKGDVFGSSITPIILSLPKVNITPLESDYSVATIVWRLRTDGSGGYDYVNGYMSHMN